MRTTVFLSTILLLTTLIACGQKPKTDKTISNQQEIIDSLKETVDQKWIIQNPMFNKTKPSFFNKDNENKYFVGLLQISGKSIPFTWDHNLSLLQFLLTLNNEINIKQGIVADENFKGTKIAWDRSINGLIWFNDEAHEATVDNWHLLGSTECLETIIFPNLSFKKVADIPNVITNNIQGLTILPYNENFKIRFYHEFNGIGILRQKDVYREFLHKTA